MTNKPLGPKELQQRGISRVTPASVVPSKPMATPLVTGDGFSATGKAKGASKRKTAPKAPPD